MPSNRMSALLGAALLASAAGATAQQSKPPPPPPSTYDLRQGNANTNFRRDYNSKVVLSSENKEVATYMLARNMAACVAKKAPAEAGKLLGGPMTSYGNYEQLTAALRKKHRGCVTQEAAVPIGIVNGALAEELVRIINPRLQDRSAPGAVAGAKAFYTAPGGVTMDTLGRCLAVHSPGLAYRVLGTAAGSADEARAIAALFAQTPECGVRAAPRDIPAMEQRSAVATGLYHWIHKG